MVIRQKLPRVSSDMVSRRPDQTAKWLNDLAARVDVIETSSKGSKTASDLPIASTTTLGAVKVGGGLSITPSGVLSASGGGTGDYNALMNKPSINQVTLQGNKELPDLNTIPIPNTDIENLINITEGI